MPGGESGPPPALLHSYHQYAILHRMDPIKQLWNTKRNRTACKYCGRAAKWFGGGKTWTMLNMDNTPHLCANGPLTICICPTCGKETKFPKRCKHYYLKNSSK